jgi:hypothetical protein
MSAPTENTSFRVTLDFPDAKARADFETAFHGWLKEYQQRITIQRALRAAEQAAEGDDTGGFLIRWSYTLKDGRSETSYINLI